MQKETLKERVYRGIYEAVTNGEYRPNDILTENQMIEKFGVSKSPVREALVELCKDGVLINIPRMGYQVRAVTLKEIMDILEFRVDVEVGGLRKSFPVLTRENINMLRMIAEKHNADEDRIVSNNWQRNYCICSTFPYSSKSLAKRRRRTSPCSLKRRVSHLSVFIKQQCLRPSGITADDPPVFPLYLTVFPVCVAEEK